MKKLSPSIDATFKKIGVESALRHVFLCVGPDCCETEEGLATWKTLKRGVKKLGIPVLRTKAACLRVCEGGPWMLVYPEGVWYGNVTPERCERIVSEHLAGGRVVGEWAVKTRPLCGG